MRARWIVSIGLVVALVASATAYAVLAPKKIIALTFDDGPSGAYTMQVLDILRGKDVQATFFVTGINAEQYPEVVRREVLDGHALGNHSYSHHSFATLDDDATYTEILGTQQIVEQIVGKSPKFIRYPFGTESPAASKAVRHLGLTGTVGWHSGGEPGRDDWRCLGVDATLQAAKDSTEPGAIILAHDANEVTACPDQLIWLSEYIDWARSRGYEFGLLRTADAPSGLNLNSWVEVVPVDEMQRWNE